MAKAFVGWIGWLSPNPLDNESCLKKVNCPVLFIHGEQDTLIPASHSKVSLNQFFGIFLAPHPLSIYIKDSKELKSFIFVQIQIIIIGMKNQMFLFP